MLCSKELGVVSVAVQVGNSSTLFKLHHNEPLDSVIEKVCKVGDQCFSKNRYGLQFIRKQADPSLSARFVTEENRHNIIDGTEIKLVYSAKELGRMILDNLRTHGDLDWALDKLSGHIADPVFASVVQGPCYILVNRLFGEESLPPKLLYYCMKFILGLLRLNYLKEIDDSLVKLLTNILCSRQSVGKNCIIEKTFLILECISKSQYNQLKESIDLEDLLFYLGSLGSLVIQRCALSLINALAANCPNEKEKRDMLVKMSSAKFRKIINSNILFPGSMLGIDIKEQLATYQCLILSLKNELFSMSDVTINKLSDNLSIKRYSSLDISLAKGSAMASDNDVRRRSAESCAQTANKASLKWKDNVVLLKERLDLLKVTNDVCSQQINPSISKLVHNCLLYFHENYNKTYSFILLAEGIDNFLRICDQVANMIAKDILHIGEPIRPKSTTVFLLVFTTFLDDSEEPALIEELFSQAMLILERTKREMKVRTLDDYEKVIKITKQKLMQGLMKDSRSFEELEISLRGITYSQATESILTETLTKKNQFYQTSPAVLELSASLREDMIELIQQQRLKYIGKRTRFLVLKEKQSGKQKGKNYLYAWLSPNGHRIIYTEDPDNPEKMSSMFIKHIKSVVAHVKKTTNRSGQNSEVIYTTTLTLLPTTDDIKPLNLITQSQEVADYWNDAINCLKGNEMRSDSLKKELTILLDMELRVRLLELDGIEIPDKAPPLPPSPPSYDFELDDSRPGEIEDQEESNC